MMNNTYGNGVTKPQKSMLLKMTTCAASNKINRMILIMTALFIFFRSGFELDDFVAVFWLDHIDVAKIGHVIKQLDVDCIEIGLVVGKNLVNRTNADVRRENRRLVAGHDCVAFADS